MLQVDLTELEHINEDVKIKEEIFSDDDDDEDESDEDFIKERKKRKVENKPVRCSPRNKNNTKRYSTDLTDDEDT